MPGYALLPCPFCGSIEIEWQSYLGNKMLRCQGCGILTNDKADEESLIAAWNRRSPTDYHDLLVAARAVCLAIHDSPLRREVEAAVEKATRATP